MSKTRNNRSIINTAIYVIAVLLVLGIIGGLIVWLAREDGLTVYVCYGEKRYTVNTVNAPLGKLNTDMNTFTVGSLTGETVDYTVDVTANSKNNFEFVANDKAYKWNSVDCVNMFTIEKQTDKFILGVKNNTTLTDFLRDSYGQDLMYMSLLADDTDYFILTVKLPNGNISMTFNVNIGDTPYHENVPAVSLSPDHIIF